MYQIAALSEKDKKVQAYTLMNLAGPDAILKSESFEYGDNESKEDPDVLVAKFKEQCMPTKTLSLTGTISTHVIKNNLKHSRRT